MKKSGEAATGVLSKLQWNLCLPVTRAAAWTAGLKEETVAAAARQEVTDAIQARDDDGLNKSGSGGGSCQLGQESGHVLERGLTGFAE